VKIISFDLDETLFIDPRRNDTEKQFKFPFNVIYKEKLRKGTIELFETLKKNKFQIYIYTTSFRSIKYIKGFFKKYKLKLDKIINGDIHFEYVQKGHRQIMPSKYPPKFKITYHVDNDLSVKQNGDTLGFKVLILKEDDKDWISKVYKFVKI
jgi:hypothetical protein